MGFHLKNKVWYIWSIIGVHRASISSPISVAIFCQQIHSTFIFTRRLCGTNSHITGPFVLFFVDRSSFFGRRQQSIFVNAHYESSTFKASFNRKLNKIRFATIKTRIISVQCIQMNSRNPPKFFPRTLFIMLLFAFFSTSSRTMARLLNDVDGESFSADSVAGRIHQRTRQPCVRLTMCHKSDWLIHLNYSRP